MKWVTALQLEQWADTIDSRTTLSEIVSGLVRASATAIQAFRFPTGDSAQIPGYDGRLSADGVAPYVPDGDSVWEFGVAGNYVQKANEDYRSRTDDARDVNPAITTFVFVTPRRWQRPRPPAEWENEKRQDRVWKDVKIIDAVALEDWLDRHPAVAARTARYVLSNVTEAGARCTDEFWEEYASRFRPALTEKVLLCDREEQAKRLLSSLSAGPQELLWRADSPDEVVAFAIAAIRGADHDTRKFLEARTLILDDENAARQLARQRNRIYIPRASASSLSGLLINYNPTIVPFGRDNTRGSVEALNRPTTRSLGTAIESMGYESDAAYQLARSCGRSVTILRRRIPNGDAGKPIWVDGTHTLVPALLAGGWDSTVEADKDALRILANVDDYETYEDQVRPKLRLQDPPIDQEGSVWKIRAPVDAFVNLGHPISARDLGNLRRVALEVFREIDPTLDQVDEDKPFVPGPRSRLRHSEWLRDGLATTLLQIAVLHQEADLTVAGSTPAAYIEGLVGSLDGLMKDYRLIASLRNQLPLLMEGAPRPLLAALERLLEADGQAILPIFRSGGGVFSSTSPHTYVLWALETRAWDPEFLPRVALILAKLARIDPGGQTINRPINSLREIFLYWHPNTNAPLAQRLAVLDQIIAAEPEVGWDLIVKLLPEGSGISHPASRPLLRESGDSDREVLTWGIVNQTQREIVDRALDLVGNTLDRWETLIKSLYNFEPALRQRAYDQLDHVIAAIADPTWRTRIWNVLLQEVNRHRAFASAAWALREPDLSRLDAILEVLQPQDVLERHAWLFDSDHPDLPIEDFETRFESVNDVRADAVDEVRRIDGNDGILRLAERVQYPQIVAVAAAEHIDDPATFDALVDGSLGRSSRLDRFAIALSGDAGRKFPEDWHQRLRERRRSGHWTADQIANLLLALSDTVATWELSESLGEDVDTSYWARKHPLWLTGSGDDVEQAVRRYLKVGRATAALEAAFKHIDRIPFDLLLSLLDAALGELSDQKSPPTHLFIHHIGEIFEKLTRRQDVPRFELAKREYKYLPLLGYFQGRQLTLHEIMAEEPGFYIQVLSDIFKAESDEKSEATEEQRARAHAGFRLLSSFQRIPGTIDSSIEVTKLLAWVQEVRRLAAEVDRARIADQYIGRVLAHGPVDPGDRALPHVAVRQVIETVGSDDLETGFKVERFNMRGVYTKALFEGGRQEREFADQARGWARAVAGYPRTASMLHALAEQWEAYANAEDIRARQDEMRYE